MIIECLYFFKYEAKASGKSKESLRCVGALKGREGV